MMALLLSGACFFSGFAFGIFLYALGEHANKEKKERDQWPND